MRAFLFALLASIACSWSHAQYDLTVTSFPAVQEGLTTYRFYVNMQDATDRMSAVYGNNEAPLTINTPDGAFNSMFNTSWNASGINPAFLTVFPELADDTFATIGLTGPAAISGIADAADPSIVEDAAQPITPYFQTDGALSAESSTLVGMSWYVLNTTGNGLPDANLQVLVLQVTTGGAVSGQLNYQVFPLGVGTDAVTVSSSFNVEPQEDVSGCTDAASCTFNPEATSDDGSCLYLDAIGVCGGDCIEASPDSPTVCAGDEVYGCINLDACNYNPEANISDGSCVGVPNLYCDCAATIPDTDNDGVCDDDEIAGCTDGLACNYNETATDDDGSCIFAEVFYDCEGNCLMDMDGDGVCDELEVEGCTDVEACNYDNDATDEDGSCLYLDALGVCGGSCGLDQNNNGVCDEEEGLSLYSLYIESFPAVQEGLTTYRFHVNMQDATDRMNAVYGNNEATLSINTPDGAYNSAFNSSWNASGINPAFLTTFPELADDTFATIGLTGPASTSGVADAADPSIVEDAAQPITPYFQTDGAVSLESNTLAGSSWYILNTAGNGLPDANLQVLVLQVTTGGGVSGQLNYQVFPFGLGANAITVSSSFNVEPQEDVPGCTDEASCTFNPEATVDDGSCEYLDAIGVCGGDCIEASHDSPTVCAGDEVYGCINLDACNYNPEANISDENLCVYPEEFFNCNGSCLDDEDADGVCDAFEEATLVTGPISIERDYSYDLGGEYANYKSYFVYFEAENQGDVLSAVFADDTGFYSDRPMGIDAPCGCLNPAQTSITIDASNNPAFFAAFPDYEYDSFWTIGMTTSEDEGQLPSNIGMGAPGDLCAGFGITNGTIFITGATGDWPVNAVAGEDLRVLIARVTTCGEFAISGNFQIFRNGSQDDVEYAWFLGSQAGTTGCTDETACNWDEEATEDDGTCEYPEAFYDCDGNCLNDADGDGVCDEFEIAGCTDEMACNFDETATDDDGSCEYAEEYYDCNGDCLNDADGDGVCDELEVAGCTNIDACNYDDSATDDDGSCILVGDACDDGDELSINDTIDGDCECIGETEGCIDIEACNYDPDASIDDGSCEYASVFFDCDGICIVDEDEDGICDLIDPCVGTLDACGICNGPGAVYDCGCVDIPWGACDCEGNVEDECGMCGGDGIAADECDCDGNQLDALGVCGGSCATDADGDGLCDDVDGCVDNAACNFDDVDAMECVFCGCEVDVYTMTVEASEAVQNGLTKYRFYVNMLSESDRLSAMYGNSGNPAEVLVPSGAYNSSLNATWNASGLNPAFLGSFPEMADDSYATIGLSGPANTSDIDGAADPSLAEDPSQLISPFFLVDGATGFESNLVVGSSWFALNTHANALPDENGRVLVMQVTSSGNVMGTLNAQIFPNGNGLADERVSWSFDGEGVFGLPDAGNACGCTDAFACNYDPSAEYDNGLCLFQDVAGVCGGDCTSDVDGDGICDDEDSCIGQEDACGVCNGPGEVYDCGCFDIPEGDCDCNGNQLDALFTCGGDCIADEDADNICDDEDPCVGVYDECGICNGPGAVYACGCAGIPEGDCDCNGNVLDALGDCGGDCTADLDLDGLCDDEDPCIGAYDECGVCNGPGAIYACGCSDVPEDDCDCEGNQLDALGVCGGSCEADDNANGVCDADELVGCTVPTACNFNPFAEEDDGSCEFYCPGCTDSAACNFDEGALQEDGSCVYPEDLGTCDCAGNVLDAVGDCGGDCDSDNDGDGVCDDEDECIGVLDACGVCNGPGAIYACGCGDVPEGDCDCNGSQLDVCGICGGDGTTCVGCTYEFACNYDPEASISDASLCEFGTCPGCTSPSACNFNPTVSEDDGTCEWCSCIEYFVDEVPGDGPYGLVVESSPAVQAGLTTYRVYVSMVNATDRLSSVYGNDDDMLSINVPDGAFNSALNASWSAVGLSNALVGFYPELADDSFATIGLDGPASESGLAGAQDPGLVEDPDQSISPLFTEQGAQEVTSNTVTGSSWFVLNEAANAAAGNNLRVLVMQLTTSGSVSGTLNYQVFPLGVGEEYQRLTTHFDGVGVFGPNTLSVVSYGCTDMAALNYCPEFVVDDGSCEYDEEGCLDDSACNYNPYALVDNGTCLYPDECGVCGGEGANEECGCDPLPSGDCDCDGNQLDALGVCGGSCDSDVNGNGICDDEEPLGAGCGPGTVVDPETGLCVVENPADINFDGCVQLEDLLDLLSAYGLCYE